MDISLKFFLWSLQARRGGGEWGVMGYTWGTVPGYTWYLVKHSPEPKRETLMLLGGVVWQGFLFGLVFFLFCCCCLREQLEDTYTRAPGVITKITKLLSSKINHKFNESSHFLWEWRGFSGWIFLFNLINLFFFLVLHGLINPNSLYCTEMPRLCCLL